MPLHLIKLCVGGETVEDLVDWQAERIAEARAAGTPPIAVHVTRMWPKREAELLDGGSLYWVIRGCVLARQRSSASSRATAPTASPLRHPARPAGRAHRAAAAPRLPGLALPAAAGRAGRPAEPRGAADLPPAARASNSPQIGVL